MTITRMLCLFAVSWNIAGFIGTLLALYLGISDIVLAVAALFFLVPLSGHRVASHTGQRLSRQKRQAVALWMTAIVCISYILLHTRIITPMLSPAQAELANSLLVGTTWMLSPLCYLLILTLLTVRPAWRRQPHQDGYPILR